MVSPSRSRRRNSGQVAQSPTRLELAISTRGAHSWVRSTPTGRPDWTSIVSSSASVVRVRTIASKLRQSRAARAVPPQTTRPSGRPAASGSRLFCSIRSGASVCQLRAVSVVPRGDRTGRAPSMGFSSVQGKSGGGEQGAVVDELDDGLDLRGEVPVGAGAFDAGRADGVPHRAGRGGRFEG